MLFEFVRTERELFPHFHPQFPTLPLTCPMSLEKNPKYSINTAAPETVNIYISTSSIFVRSTHTKVSSLANVDHA